MDIVKLPGRKYWIARFMLGGKAVFRSTKCKSKKGALAFAATLRSNTHNAVFIHPRSAKQVCTLRQIRNAYLVAPFGEPSSRNCNWRQLLKIIAPGENRDSAAVLDRSADVVLPAAITAHQKDAMEPGLRSHVSINSDVRQARAVFSRNAVDYYESQGLVMPESLAKFMKVRLLKEEMHGYVPIDPAILAEMDAAIAELKITDYELWKVLIIVRRLGLRDDELLHAKGKWIVATNEGPAFAIRNSVEFKTKNGIEREILLPPDLAKELTGIGAEKFIIRHDLLPTPRYNFIYRKANVWIRQYLPDREKGLYELRKQAGSEVATSAPGHIYDAQKFLGHKSYATTEKYYAKNLNRPRAAGMHVPAAPPPTPAKKGKRKGKRKGGK